MDKLLDMNGEKYKRVKILKNSDEKDFAVEINLLMNDGWLIRSYGERLLGFTELNDGNKNEIECNMLYTALMVIK